MQAVERKPTIKELYAALQHAKRRRDGEICSWDRTYWRNEIGRLTQEIRRATMSAQNNERETK